MRQRENNIDLLRVLACIGVILIHVGAIYGKEINNQIPFYYFKLGNIFHSLPRSSVPLFILISGSFLLSNNANLNLQLYYKKIIKKVFIPTIFFSFFYVVYSLCILFLQLKMNDVVVDYMLPFKNWILGIPFYHMWYMYMVFGLYIITPLLIRIRLYLGVKLFEVLGWLMLILDIFLNIIYPNMVWPIEFILYIGYFILGYSLKIRRKNISNIFFLSIIILLLIGLCTINELNIKYLFVENVFYFLTPLSPIVVIISLLIYRVFLNIKIIKFDFSSLSKQTFNIYLYHAGVLSVIDLLIRNFIIEYPNPLWYFPFLTLIVFVISYTLSLLQSRIIAHFVRA